MNKTATITFDGSEGCWIYRVLIDGESSYLFYCNPGKRDYEDLSNLNSIFKEVEDLVRDGYTIKYKNESDSEDDNSESEDDESV